jgi:hypothetical protein
VIVEYAGILAAVSLLAATLTGAYGQNVTAVFATSTAGIVAVGKAAKAQKVPPAGAKAAFKRAPYSKTALKYLYALGWIGGTKNPNQCGLTLLGEGAARDQAASEMRSKAKLVAQLKKRGISVATAARALTKGVVSACA